MDLSRNTLSGVDTLRFGVSCRKLVLPTCSTSDVLLGSPVQGMKERPVSVLASADVSGVVVLSVCGAYRLVSIDLKAHRSGPQKGKGRGFLGGRSGHKVDSPGQRRSRKTQAHGAGAATGGDETATEADDDGFGSGVRPLQLTLSADLSLLSALVEADGHIELVQVRVMH